MDNIVARSLGMQRLLQQVVQVADSDATILLFGETGTGKEVFARVIHSNSRRGKGPFVALNCAAIPETLFESELFGHVRGAFTSAHGAKRGLFQSANGGTLFLDEIGEMPASLQVKLLRVLQDGNVRRLGDTRNREVDVRLISATNKVLEDEIRTGAFRNDLYYRIAVVPIHLVPLRQRREEIPILVRHFIEQNNRRLKTQITGADADVMEYLVNYAWPGNVRELENTIERALVLTEATRITATDLPANITSPVAPLDGIELPDDELSVKKHGSLLEARLIRIALDRTGGNKTRAADLLELSSRALLYKIREYGI
jgi:transcriptional regulator with PAS, ATPase and Fis domain